MKVDMITYYIILFTLILLSIPLAIYGAKLLEKIDKAITKKD